MNLMTLFLNIRWLPVILMTLFSFILGMLRHRPFLFGKIWKKENYGEGSSVNVNASLVFGGTAVLHFLALSTLCAVVSGTIGLNGLAMGFLISLLWFSRPWAARICLPAVR